VSIPRLCASNVRSGRNYLPNKYLDIVRKAVLTKNRFPVADVLWTFAMAMDTYLVVFHHFDTQSLRKLEIKYISVITTLSFIPAFVFLFIRGHTKGPIYGDETVSSLERLKKPCIC
jgi:hypothetical protein